MEPETPAPFWKKLVPQPSGSIPGGLFSQVAIGLIAILGGAMIFSYQFCSGGSPPPAPAEQQSEPVTGGSGLDRQIAGMTEQKRRDQEHEERERLRREQLEQQQALAAGLGGATVSRPGRPRGGAPSPGTGQPDPGRPGGQQYQTDAEFQLMERLRLEDIERKRRSLRVGPVALSHRSGRRSAERQDIEPTPEAAPAAAPGGGDARSALPAALGDFQTGGGPLPVTGDSGPEAPDPVPETSPAQGGAAAAPAGGVADPTRIAGPFDPPGMERIYEGSFLEGVLVTQLSGEFTGPVLAMVAVPFYSADRQRILVPRGTRAVGSAQAVAGGNQERLAVGFHRLVFPDGRWVELTFDGLDQAGDAALKDKVNRHYLSMFAAVGAIGVLSGLTLRGSHPYEGGMAGFRAGAGRSMGQSATQILNRFLNRFPTITIRAGHRLRIWFTSDVLVPRPPPQGERQ